MKDFDNQFFLQLASAQPVSVRERLKAREDRQMINPLTNPEFLFEIVKNFFPDNGLGSKVVRYGMEPFGCGSIHDTYKLSVEFAPARPAAANAFLLQRINTAYFKEPDILAENYRSLSRVFSGYRRRQRLTAVPLSNGSLLYVDVYGGYWRLFEFVENSYSVTVLENDFQAYEIARVYGDFLQAASEIGMDGVCCAIPSFHDTLSHLHKLQMAVVEDEFGRASQCQSEIDFINSKIELIVQLQALAVSDLPLRITHNDTGLSNVLLDCKSRSALCAVDWDTVMPGTSAIDFGDLLRSSLSLDPSFNLPKTFESLVRGYLAGAGGLLESIEIKAFLPAGELIALELGIRYLTDYLRGDIIFRGYDDSSLNSGRRSLARFCLLHDYHDELQKILDNILTEQS